MLHCASPVPWEILKLAVRREEELVQLLTFQKISWWDCRVLQPGHTWCHEGDPGPASVKLPFGMGVSPHHRAGLDCAHPSVSLCPGSLGTLDLST